MGQEGESSMNSKGICLSHPFIRNRHLKGLGWYQRGWSKTLRGLNQHMRGLGQGLGL